MFWSSWNHENDANFNKNEKMTSSTPRRERTIYNFTRKDNNVVMVARFIILAVLFLMNVFKLTNGWIKPFLRGNYYVLSLWASDLCIRCS